MPHNLYIVGFMACGKSSAGKQLSAVLGVPLIDTDREVEKRMGMSVPAIFSRFGEERFRTEESRVLRGIEPQNGIVVTGGGLPCFHGNMAYMNRNGITLYMEVPAEVIAERLRNDVEKNRRPLLNGIEKKDVLSFVRKGIKEREPFYLQARHRFKGQEESFENLCRWVSDILRVDGVHNKKR